MWYTRNKFYSETAEENLQEAKIACDVESPMPHMYINPNKLYFSSFPYVLCQLLIISNHSVVDYIHYWDDA